MFHEGLIALFRENPALAPELLQQSLHVTLPAFSEIRLDEADFTQLVPTQYRADLVILLVDGKPVYGIILEIQLAKNEEKRFSWNLYQAALRAKLRCPTCVLVVAPDSAVATWAAQPIDTGQPGSAFVPLVLGPQGIPLLTEAGRAQTTPEMAVLSSLAHGNEVGGWKVVMATLAALDGISDEKARFYYDLVMSRLNAVSRQALEEMMQSGAYQYQSEFARKYVAEGRAEGEAKGKAEGKAEGEAQAVLMILATRGLAISEPQREQILACQDLATLEQWLKKAITAASVAEIIE